MLRQLAVRGLGLLMQDHEHDDGPRLGDEGKTVTTAIRCVAKLRVAANCNKETDVVTHPIRRP